MATKSAAPKTTVTVGGVPYTASSPEKAQALAAKDNPTAATAASSSTSPSRGSAGWIDPIRAPGDTKYTDQYGTPTDAAVQDANAPGVNTAPPVQTPALAPSGAPQTQQGTPPVAPMAPNAPVATPAAAPTPTQTKYQAGLATLQASGTPAPSDAGVARSAIASVTPQTPDTTAVDNYMSQDPAINTLMQGITQLLNPQNQTSTLMQDYTKLRKSSGLDKINQEMIDADTVINGTEDDIRNEIQTAGGLGTESQVQAMTLARNKGLLTRYNQLVQMKTDATNQLNTMMSLNQQDKQMAQERVNQQIGAMFNMANFRQTALNNTRSQYQWLAEQQGADGLYNSLAQDPRQLSFAEQILGTGSGGLQKLAQQASKDRAQKLASDNLDMSYKRAEIANINSQISERNKTSQPISVDVNSLLKGGGDAYAANKSAITQILQSPQIPAAAKTQIGTTLGVIDAAADLANANANGKFAGINPLTGILNTKIFGVGLPFRNTTKGSAQIQNEGYIDAINLKTQQWASGASLTSAQTEQVNRFVPTAADTDSTVRTKLNNLTNFMLTQTQAQLEAQGVGFQPAKVNLFETYDLLQQASPEQKKQLQAAGLL